MPPQEYRCPRCHEPTPRGNSLGPRPYCCDCREELGRLVAASPTVVGRDLARRLGISRGLVSRLAAEYGEPRKRGPRPAAGPARGCSIDGCNKRMMYPTAGLCQMHWTRLQRNGTTDRQTTSVRRSTDRGYILVKLADHPLADQHGWVYEHRAVAYDACDGVPGECGWCLLPLRDWTETHIDHIDFARHHNDPSNLMRTCAPCNRRRMPHGDAEAWAMATAARIVLRQHADEVELEYVRIVALNAAGDSGFRSAIASQRKQFNVMTERFAA
jgi:hypothetical protein